MKFLVFVFLSLFLLVAGRESKIQTSLEAESFDSLLNELSEIVEKDDQSSSDRAFLNLKTTSKVKIPLETLLDDQTKVFYLSV